MTEIEKIKENLSKLYDCEIIPEDFGILYSRQFAINFLKNINHFYSEKGITRSNWTHNTANSFLNTCVDLNLLCEFEVENRHDGAIRNSNGVMYICAEWEYDTNSVFKEKGEIEKIYQTCRKHKFCEGILLTYQINDRFEDYITKIYHKWNSLLTEKDNFRIIVLTVIISKNSEDSQNYISGIRTVMIGKKTIDILEDLILN